MKTTNSAGSTSYETITFLPEGVTIKMDESNSSLVGFGVEISNLGLAIAILDSERNRISDRIARKTREIKELERQIHEMQDHAKILSKQIAELAEEIQRKESEEALPLFVKKAIQAYTW